MLRSLFGKGKKAGRPDPRRDTRPVSATDSISNVRVGDEVSIVGLTEGFDEVYRSVERRDSFVIEQVNRYESDAGEWFEAIGVDGERRLWLEWAEEDELFVTATMSKKPMGLSSFGLTEKSLIRMDEEHDIDNVITHDGARYFYKNSHEVAYYEDDGDEGEAFYLWDFVNEDRSRALSVVKWEGVPFQGFISEIVPPENISVSKLRKPGNGG